MYTIRKYYYDDPIEDGSGYYYHDFTFADYDEAVKSFYEMQDSQDCSDPVGFSTDFDIPLEIRIQHDDVVYEIRNLRGDFIERFHSLSEAKTYAQKENQFVLALIRSNPKEKERAELYQKYYCRVYIA